MKSFTSPRRLYVVSGLPVVSFKGKLYTPDLGDMSAVDASAPVVIADFDTASATVTVRQAREKAKSIVETWTLRGLPTLCTAGVKYFGSANLRLTWYI